MIFQTGDGVGRECALVVFAFANFGTAGMQRCGWRIAGDAGDVVSTHGQHGSKRHFGPGDNDEQQRRRDGLPSHGVNFGGWAATGL